MADRFLLADVGGTNTRVGLGGAKGLDPASVEVFRNVDQSGLSSIFADYLGENPVQVRAVCAGVAGPVRDGHAQLTNLNWFIDGQELTEVTGTRSVHLFNDLQVQGYALDDLPSDSVTSLFSGAAVRPDATRLVMGLGTGCNIAVVHRTLQGLWVPPSETGHTSLPYLDADAGDLIRYLSQSHYHKPIEAALSGPGLSRIFRYLSGKTLPAAEVINCHMCGDIDATDALRLFTEILGTVAGNIALAHLPMGGLYFSGGAARAVAPHLAALGFAEHFTAKGPYTPIMQDIPVLLVDDDFAALRGCARYLLQSAHGGRDGAQCQ